ncbi:MAG: hypothetical protein DRQ44_09995, partial [Gammaproteobacteria bacterium]
MKKVKLSMRTLMVGALSIGWLGSANAGVVGSQHDLTSGGAGQTGTAVTDQVCVFCHTPHGSDTNA